MRIGISLLTWNYFEYTERCLESLVRTLKHPSELVILDNGSSDGTPLKITSMQLATRCKPLMSAKFIFEKENQGLIKGRNLTLGPLLMSPSVEYILLIHNDHILTEGMIEGLLEVFEAEPKAGIVGTEIFQSKDVPVIEDLEKWAKEKRQKKWHRGNCHPCLMKVSALKEILMPDGKLYDESFGAQDNEDIDALGRLEDAGYKTLVTETAWAWHRGELSRSLRPDAQQEKYRSRSIYERKWHNMRKVPWDHRKDVNYERTPA